MSLQLKEDNRNATDNVRKAMKKAGLNLKGVTLVGRGLTYINGSVFLYDIHGVGFVNMWQLNELESNHAIVHHIDMKNDVIRVGVLRGI